MEMVKCSGPGCNREFESRIGKKYCSGSCRAKASVANQLSLGSLQETKPAVKPMVKTQNFASPPNTTDPASAFIIEQLKQDRDRWKKEYDDERALAKKLKDEKESLEKQILKMENDQRISAIENEKPSALNGFLQNEKLLELCAPLIQKILEPSAAMPQQIAGTPGQQTPAAMFEAWFMKLSLPTQRTVWNMLQQFSIMPDADMNQYAASVIEQLKYAYPNQAANQ